MKKLLIYVFIFSTLTSHAAESVKGCVAFFTNGTPKLSLVDLVPFEGGVLKNTLIDIQGFPTNLQPDEKGHFCYGLNDDRLAYVTMYYFASKMLQEYNTLLIEMGHTPIKLMPIVLEKDFTKGKCIGSGEAKIDHIFMTFQNPALDYTVIDHEIGHKIQHHLQDYKRLNISESEEDEVGGITEGTGNILAALHLDKSHIGLIENEELSSDVNQYVAYPFLGQKASRIHYEQFLTFLKSQGAKCELDVKEIKQFLRDPIMAEYFNEPSEYEVSAVINQPIWQASKIFGKSVVQKLYLKALLNIKKYTYRDFASTLVSQSEDPKLTEFLEKAYLERGLIP